MKVNSLTGGEYAHFMQTPETTMTGRFPMSKVGFQSMLHAILPTTSNYFYRHTTKRAEAIFVFPFINLSPPCLCLHTTKTKNG